MTIETDDTISHAPESTSGGAGKAEQASIDSFKAFEAEQSAAAEKEAQGAEKPAAEETPEAGAAEAKDGAKLVEGEKPAEKSTASEGSEDKKDAETGDKAAARSAKKSAKERIGELVKDRSTAERERDDARRERDEDRAEIKRLREENEALKNGKKPEKVAAELKEGEPDPEKYEYGVLDPQYVKDVREFDRAELRKELDADRQREAAERQALELEKQFDDRVEAFDAEVGDYVEVVVKGAQEQTWACTPEMNVHIKTSEVGPQLAYHLAKNPAESIKVAKMDPIDQAKWFGRKEAELSTPPEKGKSTTKPPVSKADPPAGVVRGQAGKFAPNPATTDFSKFEKDFAHLLTPT